MIGRAFLPRVAPRREASYILASGSATRELMTVLDAARMTPFLVTAVTSGPRIVHVAARTLSGGHGWAPSPGGEHPLIDTASPACSLHLVDPAYSGLDEDGLARAYWRARRGRRRRTDPTTRGSRRRLAMEETAGQLGSRSAFGPIPTPIIRLSAMRRARSMKNAAASGAQTSPAVSSNRASQRAKVASSSPMPRCAR